MALDSGNEKNFYARLNRRRVLGWKRLKPFKSIFNWNKWSITPLLIIRASLLFLRSAAVSINQNIRTTADISSKLQCQNRAHMSSHLALIRSYPGRGGKGGGGGGRGGEGGSTQHSFTQMGSTLRSKSFTLSFLTGKVPLSYTFYW